VGTHTDRVCKPIIHCTPTQWESRAPGARNNRECTDRGTCLVTVDDTPAYYPSNSITGNPAKLHFVDAFASNGGEALTDAFDNVQFTTKSAAPVQNLKCTGGWCMYNGGDVDDGQCVNDGDWGWIFHRPVKRVALATPDYTNFKSASVWIYDVNGMVLERRTIGALHEGNQFLAFKSSCGIAKVRLQIHDYVAGSKFCLRKIWYDGQEQPKACTHTVCKRETHTCQHWRKDHVGIIQPHIAATGRCNNVVCSANGNCNGIKQYHNIRVHHRIHDGQIDRVGLGWKLKGDAGMLEANCLKTHRCGMGVVTNDKSKCECKQM
jgi:hypothetical protein